MNNKFKIALIGDAIAIVVSIVLAIFVHPMIIVIAIGVIVADIFVLYRRGYIAFKK